MRAPCSLTNSDGTLFASLDGVAFRFEWDPVKATENFAKHDVTFEDAITIFDDPLELAARDKAHSWDEDRWVSIGATMTGPLVVVFYAERGAIIRIISARLPTGAERRAYEEDPGQ